MKLIKTRELEIDDKVVTVELKVTEVAAFHALLADKTNVEVRQAIEKEFPRTFNRLDDFDTWGTYQTALNIVMEA
jgi:hypothetical protein